MDNMAARSGWKKRTTPSWQEDILNQGVTFPMINTQDVEEMKKKIEEFTQQYSSIKQMIFTVEEIQQAKKAVQDQIRIKQDELTRYDEMLSFIDTLEFKEGDVAFHKDHGNVIVSGLTLHEAVQDSQYVIVTKTGRKIAVATKDLLPISEATKVLYGKG